MRRAGAEAPRRWAALWAWGLRDEVFAQALGALTRGQRFGEGWMFGLGLGADAARVGGTGLGAWAGGGALAAFPAVAAGLGFMLAALFLSLLLPIATRAALPVIAVAAAATVAGAVAYGAAYAPVS